MVLENPNKAHQTVKANLIKVSTLEEVSNQLDNDAQSSNGAASGGIEESKDQGQRS